MTTSSLEVSGVELRYGTFQALKGIDLSLDSGQFLALLGPSGCGKTSLLRSIAGFERPQAGAIEVDGKDMMPLRPRERNLGMVFQHYALFPHLTALGNVAFGLKCRGTPRAELADRATMALDLVGLSHLADRRPRQLSGGQQQRVALARALVIEPNLLLLDEPLGALDRKLRIEMQTELRRIQQRLGVTAVFVTHDQEEAMAMADKIAIMRDGVIEQVGGPQDIFAAPASHWAAEFIGSGNLVCGALRPNGKGGLDLDGVPGVDLSVSEQAATGRLQSDGRGTLFVRAEKLTLTAQDEDAVPGTARVTSQRYLGVHYEVHVETAAGPVRALVAPESASQLEVGRPVTVSAAPEQIHLLPLPDKETT